MYVILATAGVSVLSVLFGTFITIKSVLEERKYMVKSKEIKIRTSPLSKEIGNIQNP